MTLSTSLFRKPGLFLFSVTLLLSPCDLAADETDNFYLPLDSDFADLGTFMEILHTDAIVEGVRKVNTRIEQALNYKDSATRQRELNRLHTPEMLAATVASQFGDALSETTRIENMLARCEADKTFLHLKTRHSDHSMNFRAHTIYDPRAVLKLLQGSTVKVYGVYFGTDKLLHFHQVGHRYYSRYQSHIARGLSAEAARSEVIEYYAKEGFFAEAKGFGLSTTGVYSNADLASNCSGFTFFLNLTEAVVLRGRRREPLVVKCGAFWRVNDHVRPESGWFAPFISDHWNEALNPNLYKPAMRERVRKVLRSRADRIVEFYTRKDGRPKDAAYFENLARELSTWEGENYGHSGQFEELLHIGNSCMSALDLEGQGQPSK